MNDYWDRKPDLTRLPPHLKESLDKEIPMRPYEVRARVLLFQVVGQNHPNGRLVFAPHRPNSESSQIEGVSIEMLDHKGKRALSTAVVNTEAFLQAFQGAVVAYQRAGGSLDDLRKFIEEIENGGSHSRAEGEMRPYGEDRHSVDDNSGS